MGHTFEIVSFLFGAQRLKEGSLMKSYKYKYRYLGNYFIAFRGLHWTPVWGNHQLDTWGFGLMVLDEACSRSNYCLLVVSLAPTLRVQVQ